jgi:hypothetical protein
MSRTSHLIIDGPEQNITFSEAPGYYYMFSCCRTEGRYSFDDIQQVGYAFANIKVNGVNMYNPVIVLKSEGRQIVFGNYASQSELQKPVLAMHYL